MFEIKDKDKERITDTIQIKTISKDATGRVRLLFKNNLNDLFFWSYFTNKESLVNFLTLNPHIEIVKRYIIK